MARDLVEADAAPASTRARSSSQRPFAPSPARALRPPRRAAHATGGGEGSLDAEE